MASETTFETDRTERETVTIGARGLHVDSSTPIAHDTPCTPGPYVHEGGVDWVGWQMSNQRRYYGERFAARLPELIMQELDGMSVGNGRTLRLANVRLEQRASGDEEETRRNRGTLSYPLTADLSIADSAGRTLVNRRGIEIGRVPAPTMYGTYMVNGTDKVIRIVESERRGETGIVTGLAYSDPGTQLYEAAIDGVRRMKAALTGLEFDPKKPEELDGHRAFSQLMQSELRMMRREKNVENAGGMHPQALLESMLKVYTPIAENVPEGQSGLWTNDGYRPVTSGFMSVSDVSEGANLRKGAGLTLTTYIDVEGHMCAPVRKAEWNDGRCTLGPLEWRTMEDLARRMVAYNDFFHDVARDDEGKEVPGSGMETDPRGVGVRLGDRVFYMDPAKGVLDADGVTVRRPEYVFADPMSFKAAANIHQVAERANDDNRNLMGGKQMESTMPTEDTEPALVSDYATMTGVLNGFVHSRTASIDGTVTAVRDEGGATVITVEGAGRTENILLERHVRRNDRTDWNLHPAVKEGDRVKAGDVVAEAPFIRDGKYAIGVNLVCARMEMPGANDDGAVVSESAANGKLAVTEVYRETIPLGTNAQIHPTGIDELVTKTNVGDVVSKGDVLADMHVPKGNTVHGLDRIVSGDFEKDRKQVRLDRNIKGGTVTRSDIIDGPDGEQRLVIEIEYRRPLRVGDKITGLEGDKATCSRVVPDEEMPSHVLPDGRRVTADLIVDPNTDIKRGYPGRWKVALASYAAELTGQYVDVPLGTRDEMLELDRVIAASGLPTDGRMPSMYRGARCDADISWGMLHVLRNHKDVDDTVAMIDRSGSDSMGSNRDGSMQSEALARVLSEHPAIASEISERGISRKTLEGLEGVRLVSPPLENLFGGACAAVGSSAENDGDIIEVRTLDDDGIRAMSGGEVKTGLLWGPDGKPHPDGLLSERIFGESREDRRVKTGHIELGMPVLFYTSRIMAGFMGLSEAQLDSMMKGHLSPAVDANGAIRWNVKEGRPLLVANLGPADSRGPWYLERLISVDPGMKPDAIAKRLEERGKKAEKALEDASRISDERGRDWAEAKARSELSEVGMLKSALKELGDRDASALFRHVLPVGPAAMRPVNDREGETVLGVINERYKAIVSDASALSQRKDAINRIFEEARGRGVTLPNPKWNPNGLLLDMTSRILDNVHALEGTADIGMTKADRAYFAVMESIRDGNAPTGAKWDTILKGIESSRRGRQSGRDEPVWPDISASDRRNRSVCDLAADVLGKLGADMGSPEMKIARTRAIAKVGARTTSAGLSRRLMETDGTSRDSSDIDGREAATFVTGKNSPFRTAYRGKFRFTDYGRSVVTAYARSGEVGAFDLESGSGMKGAIDYYTEAGTLAGRLVEKGIGVEDIVDAVTRIESRCKDWKQGEALVDISDDTEKAVAEALGDLVGEVRKVGSQAVGIPYSSAMEHYRGRVFKAMREIADGDGEPYFERMAVESGMVAEGESADRARDQLIAKAIDEGHPMAKDALRAILDDEVVLVLRQPVLSANSVVAARPVAMEGESVVFSHVINEGLNADHDGDTVSYVFLNSKEAKEEALGMMRSGVLDISTGEPIMTPAQSALGGLSGSTKMDQVGEIRFKATMLVDEVSASVDESGVTDGKGKVYARQILDMGFGPLPEGESLDRPTFRQISGEIWEGRYRESNDGNLVFVAEARDSISVSTNDSVMVRAGDITGPDTVAPVERSAVHADTVEDAIDFAKGGLIRFTTPVQIGDDESRWTTAGRLMLQQAVPEYVSDDRIYVPAGETDGWYADKKWVKGIIEDTVWKEGEGQEAARKLAGALEDHGCMVAPYLGNTDCDNVVMPLRHRPLMDRVPETAEECRSLTQADADAYKEYYVQNAEQVTEGPNIDTVEAGIKGKVDNMVDRAMMYGNDGMDEAIRTQQAGQRQEQAQKGSDAAQSGGLAQYVQVSTAHYRVRMFKDYDCGTERGLAVKLKPEEDLLSQIKITALGSRLSKDAVDSDGNVVVRKGEMVGLNEARRMADAGITEFEKRSPLTCRCADGVCPHCFGSDPMNMDYNKKDAPENYQAGPNAGDAQTKVYTQSGMNKNQSAGKKSAQAEGMPKYDGICRGTDRMLRTIESKFADDPMSAAQEYKTYLGKGMEGSFMDRWLEVQTACAVGVRLRDGNLISLGEYNDRTEKGEDLSGAKTAVMGLNAAAEQIFHDDMARRLTGGATKINDVLTGAKAVPGAEYTADVPETWKIRDRTEKPERKAPRVQIYIPEKSSELER